MSSYSKSILFYVCLSLYITCCLNAAGIDGLAGRLVASLTDATTTPKPTSVLLNSTTTSISPQLMQDLANLTSEFFFITLAPMFDAVDGDKILISTNGSHMDIRKMFVDPHNPEKTVLISREVLTVEEAITKYNITPVEEMPEEIFPDPFNVTAGNELAQGLGSTTATTQPQPIIQTQPTTPTSITTSFTITPTITRTLATIPFVFNRPFSKETPEVLTLPKTSATLTTLLPTLNTRPTGGQSPPGLIPGFVTPKWDLSDYEPDSKGDNNIVVIFTMDNETLQQQPQPAEDYPQPLPAVMPTKSISATSTIPKTTLPTIPPPKQYLLKFSVVRGMNYSNDLEDPGSLLYLEHSKRIKQSVGDIFDRRYGSNHVESKNIIFSEGSVVVQLPLQIPGDSSVTKDDLQKGFLNGLVNQTISGTKYEIDPQTVQVLGIESMAIKSKKRGRDYYPAYKATAIVVGILAFFFLLAVFLVLVLALKRTKEDYSRNPITGLSYKKHGAAPNKYAAGLEEGMIGVGNKHHLHSTPAVAGFSPKIMSKISGSKKTNGNYSPNPSDVSANAQTQRSGASFNSEMFQQQLKKLTAADIKMLPADHVEGGSLTKGIEAGNTYDEATHTPDPHKSSVTKSKEPAIGEQIYMNVPKSGKSMAPTSKQLTNSRGDQSNGGNAAASNKIEKESSGGGKKKAARSSTDNSNDNSPDSSVISPISSGIFKRDPGGYPGGESNNRSGGGHVTNSGLNTKA